MKWSAPDFPLFLVSPVTIMLVAEVAMVGAIAVSCSVANEGAAKSQAIAKAEERRRVPDVPRSADSLPNMSNGAIVVLAHDAIKEKLFDPEAAMFRRETVRVPFAGSPAVVCGEVNGKNRFGGYTGFVSYVSNGAPEATARADTTGARAFRRAWKKLCVDSALR